MLVIISQYSVAMKLRMVQGIKKIICNPNYSVTHNNGVFLLITQFTAVENTARFEKESHKSSSSVEIIQLFPLNLLKINYSPLRE